MYKKWIIYLAAYVSLLFCFIKVFAYDVLEKDTMVRKQGLVASGQRVVDYKVLEKIVKGISYDNAVKYFGFDVK